MLIGLTGGIGSGKSTMAGMLQELGATVIDADQGARAVVEPGTEGFAQVVAEFGPEYVVEGRLDRTHLARLVFQDPDARRRLEAITHPLVRQWMAERTRQAVEAGQDKVVYEIPLLYEGGLDAGLAAVIVVWVPPELQLERLVEGQGYDPDHARSRIAAQIPIDEKRSRADYVIDNSGSLERTREQAAATWAMIASRASR